MNGCVVTGLVCLNQRIEFWVVLFFVTNLNRKYIWKKNSTYFLKWNENSSIQFVPKENSLIGYWKVSDKKLSKFKTKIKVELGSNISFVCNQVG